MPWESLKKSLSRKPCVLAGPMLRKLTPKETTVWLALRKRGNVTLTVFEATGNNPLMWGKRHTVAVGDNLHIVAVTAKLLPVVADLAEGRSYRYELIFDFDDGVVNQTPCDTVLRGVSAGNHWASRHPLSNRRAEIEKPSHSAQSGSHSWADRR